jgi:hypothetical protein
MTHGTRQLVSFASLALLSGLALLPCSACGKGTGAAADAAAAPSGSGPAGSWLTRRTGVLPSGMPKPPPPSDSAAIMPTATREPDWDLNRDDAARDYAGRYVVFTKRYDDPPNCIELEPSKPAGNQRSVEVRTAAACPGAGTVRDVFLVDVASDHMTVDDKSKRAPLARWPDGSDPEGPANPVREIVAMRDWKGSLNDAIRRQMLVPIRVQAYGRGTYPVISLAGWHGVVQLNATADTLAPAVGDLCQGNGGMPLALLSASDRSHLLRIRCPASIRWDTL